MRLPRSLPALLLAMALAAPSLASEAPAGCPNRQALTRADKFVLGLGIKVLRWEKPIDPVQIVGPLHFVGTKGLGAFLFTAPEGLVLLNTGLPSSGPQIEASLRKLGYRVEDVRFLIGSHAHNDHAGAFAYIKERSGATLAIMQGDVAAIESGGRDDFRYGDGLAFPPVKVDRVLKDGDTIQWGSTRLTAHHTPGHTRGATTWTAEIPIDGRTFLVAFPDGAGFNRGYCLVGNSLYPDIADDYRRTHHKLEMLRPDIWLAGHNQYYDLMGKLRRARTEGVQAWIDPDGYRRFVADKKHAFDEEFDTQMRRYGSAQFPSQKSALTDTAGR